jgi:acyl-CoA dehydrogenase
VTALKGGVFADGADDLTELRELADDIGTRAATARIGHRTLPDAFDTAAWDHLQEAGLTRLCSTAGSGGGPAEVAVVLRALARHAVTVPLAETDLMACWLAAEAGLEVPATGPLTVATGAAGDPGTATLTGVPYAGDAAAVLLALRDGEDLLVGTPGDLAVTRGHNSGGEPRDAVTARFDPAGLVRVNAAAELDRRGAWARCVAVIGALDAAVEYSVAHTREREQFGRPLSAFQSVQHALATMAGDVERARAAAGLAVAAAAEDGFASPRADYAVTVAKATLGRVVPAVSTAAHQLHGAIGVTVEHRLWLATQRARSWIGEFGDTAHHARRLGRMALAAADPWDLVVDGSGAAG